MARYDCTLMTEQSAPRDLVRYARRAEHVVGGGWPPVNVRHRMLERP